MAHQPRSRKFFPNLPRTARVCARVGSEQWQSAHFNETAITQPLASAVRLPSPSSATARPLPLMLMIATIGALPEADEGVPPVCFNRTISPFLNGPATNVLPVSL